MVQQTSETSKGLLWEKMRKDLDTLCEQAKGVLGYSVLDLDSGDSASFNEDVLMPTASTIKIAILFGLALRVHAGELEWETRVPLNSDEKVGGSGILGHLKHDVSLSVWDHASLMISLSDNTATNICIRLAGMEFINKSLDELGLKKTRIKRIMMDVEAAQAGRENVSTAAELLELVRRIEQRDGISEGVAKDVLSLLELPKGGAFQEGLPEGVRRANKPGGLGNLSVDAGIIYLSKKRFALTTMGSFLEGKPSKWTADIVKTAYSYMALLNKCTDLGRS